jgi:hypothetical protein
VKARAFSQIVFTGGISVTWYAFCRRLVGAVVRWTPSIKDSGYSSPSCLFKGLHLFRNVSDDFYSGSFVSRDRRNCLFVSAIIHALVVTV